MRRIGNLWERFISYKNLYEAFKKAFKGTDSIEADRFYYNLEYELVCIKNHLKKNTYKPDAYRFFTINDPKQRLISVAPFKRSCCASCINKCT